MSIGGGFSPFAALEKAVLFEGVDRSEVIGAALRMTPRRFDTGEAVCRAGEAGDSVFIIVDGMVNVLQAGDGSEQQIVAKQRRGEVVGALSLLTGEPRSATVLAGMPTEALELQRDEFEGLLERFPVILRNLSRILSRSLARSKRLGGDDRGEAVGLIIGPSLMPLLPDITEATRAASAGSVESLDTRTGFDSVVTELDRLLEDHATVLVAARAQGRTAPLLLQHVDRAVILTSDERDVSRFAHDEKSPLEREQVEVVLVERSTPADRSAGLLRIVRVITPAAGTGELRARDMAWLGRHLSGTKLGLALGAGGAKGYAHIGALRVLEEAGYTVDYVAGSSIGAIVGCYLAMGMAADEIDSTLRRSFTAESVAEIFKLSLAGRSTGLETMTRILRETTGDRSFEDVLIPLAVMCVDLTAREPAPIREGPLWEALLAATALAGMFPPHEREGHRFVDGLALVPVPTGAVTADGADVTVSVNLMSRETLPAWPGETGPPAPPSSPRGSRMLDNLLEVMDLMQLDTSIRNAGLADVVVSPRFGPGSWRDFHLADFFLEAGRKAAEEQLPVLQALARPQFSGTYT